MGERDIKHGIQEKVEKLIEDGVTKIVTTQYTINPMDTAELPDGMFSATIVNQTVEILADTPEGLER